LTHSANWLGPLADDDAGRFERELDRWLAYLRELEAPAIGYGAIVLRRRSNRRSWTHVDTLPLDRLEPASDHTLRVFAAHDYLHQLGDEGALLDARVALTERHRLEQTLRCDSGGFRVDAQTLGLEDGLAFRIGIDRYTTVLLPHLDGDTTVRDALMRAAADLELARSDRERFAQAALPVVRRLLELGFLEPRG
jgi:hypothetical protein